MPEYWLTRRHPTQLHEAFTVAWWEQRGAGLSYHPNIYAETMTVEQFIDDTITVAGYLCQRFEVDKVHLMAHSWGSFIGLQAAAPLFSVFMKKFNGFTTYGPQRRLVKKPNRFHMIRMGVRDQYAIDLSERELEMGQAGTHMLEEFKMAWVNDYLLRFRDQVGVRVVRPRVPPDKCMQAPGNFHTGILSP